LLTRDNLDQRRKVEDKTCLFCEEPESIHHLFFECVVAKQAWSVVSVVIGFQIGTDFESMTKCWLCNIKFGAINMLSSTLCWSIWKLKNMLCFHGVAWKEHEVAMAVGDTDVEMLESAHATEDYDRLRRCHQLLANLGLATREIGMLVLGRTSSEEDATTLG
jgi:hypothetical protein